MDQPTPEQALKAIQLASRLGQYTQTRHRERDEHHVSIADQEHAIMNATEIKRKEADGNWELAGPDTDGDELRVIVDLKGRVPHVVTVFGGRDHD